MVVSVPRCAGISKSSSGNEMTQESDLMSLRFKSSAAVILKVYLDP